MKTKRFISSLLFQFEWCIESLIRFIWVGNWDFDYLGTWIKREYRKMNQFLFFLSVVFFLLFRIIYFVRTSNESSHVLFLKIQIGFSIHYKPKWAFTSDFSFYWNHLMLNKFRYLNDLLLNAIGIFFLFLNTNTQ